MCGKGIHRVELFDGKPGCYMDYFCTIDLCGGVFGERDEPQCPHNGKGSCTCTPDEEADDE